MRNRKEVKTLELTYDEVHAVYLALDLYFPDVISSVKAFDNFSWVVNLVHVYDKLKDHLSKKSSVLLDCTQEEYSAVADYIYHFLPVCQNIITEMLEDEPEESPRITGDFQDLLSCFLKFSKVSGYHF